MKIDSLRHSISLALLCAGLVACAASDEAGTEPCDEKCEEMADFQPAHYPSQDVLRCWLNVVSAECDTLESDYEVEAVQVYVEGNLYLLEDQGEGHYSVYLERIFRKGDKVSFSFWGDVPGRLREINHGLAPLFDYVAEGEPVLVGSAVQTEIVSIFDESVEEAWLYVDYDLGGDSEPVFPFLFRPEGDSFEPKVGYRATVSSFAYTPGTSLAIRTREESNKSIPIEGGTWLLHTAAGTEVVDGL